MTWQTVLAIWLIASVLIAIPIGMVLRYQRGIERMRSEEWARISALRKIERES